MKFRCINNQDVEDLLILNKEYKGYSIAGIAVNIYRCEDKKPGTFKIERFVEVPEADTVSEPVVKINSYTLTTD